MNLYELTKHNGIMQIDCGVGLMIDICTAIWSYIWIWLEQRPASYLHQKLFLKYFWTPNPNLTQEADPCILVFLNGLHPSHQVLPQKFSQYFHDKASLLDVALAKAQLSQNLKLTFVWTVYQQ